MLVLPLTEQRHQSGYITVTHHLPTYCMQRYWRIVVQLPMKARDFSLLQNKQTSFRAHLAPCSISYWELFTQESRNHSIKLTTDLHLLPWLQMCRAIPPLPVCLHSIHRDNFTFGCTSSQHDSTFSLPHNGLGYFQMGSLTKETSVYINIPYRNKS